VRDGLYGLSTQPHIPSQMLRKGVSLTTNAILLQIKSLSAHVTAPAVDAPQTTMAAVEELADGTCVWIGLRRNVWIAFEEPVGASNEQDVFPASKAFSSRTQAHCIIRDGAEEEEVLAGADDHVARARTRTLA
jgi:hypothetical protein